jgi:hypothetical protein
LDFQLQSLSASRARHRVASLGSSPNGSLAQGTGCTVLVTLGTECTSHARYYSDYHNQIEGVISSPEAGKWAIRVIVTAFHNLDLQCDDRDVAVIPGFTGNDLDASDKRARRVESTQLHLMQSQPKDTCADYNVFGRDPDGRIAFLAALFFGPNWVPLCPHQQFSGPPEPPRYGPPAQYQLQCLPKGFVAAPPPNYFSSRPSLPFRPSSPLSPPAGFDISCFDALRNCKIFSGGEIPLHRYWTQ